MTDEGAKVLAAAIDKLANAINRNHGISLPQFPVVPIPTLPQPAYPYQPEKMPICGCDAGGVCLNAACPHRLIVTCSSSETAKA